LKSAVNWYINHNILRNFLELHSSEVINMLFTEWNWDTALEVRWEEGREEGIEQGIEQGREMGHQEGIEQGREMGHQEGIEQGREEGIMQMREAAVRLAEMGLSVEKIAAGLGISVDEAEKALSMGHGQK
jgi:predicted transposase YdaD